MYSYLVLAAIRAVGKAAQYVILEVRRQFKEIPGIMEGTAKPDYANCVDIVTKGALKEMIFPGILVISAPIIVGVVLGKEAAAGFSNDNYNYRCYYGSIPK